MFYLLFAVLAAEFLLFSFAWHCQKKRFERLLSNCADLATRVAALEHDLVDSVETLKHIFGGKINAMECNLGARVEALEHGVVPDFEEAKRAAEAVNDFNRGLSAIMNFDPIAEAKRARNEENAKGGV